MLTFALIVMRYFIASPLHDVNYSNKYIFSLLLFPNLTYDLNIA